MSNYYEKLSLISDAIMAEIKTALDTRYNKVCELVTHPDAEIRVVADLKLRLLKHIRTLTTTGERVA